MRISLLSMLLFAFLIAFPEQGFKVLIPVVLIQSAFWVFFRCRWKHHTELRGLKGYLKFLVS